VKNRIDLRLPDEEFAMVAERQKAYFAKLAESIESGAAMESVMDRKLAAGAIRAFADSIPKAQKRKQGPAPKICGGSEALTYAASRLNPNGPLPHGEAVARIADRLEVSEQAVEKAIKPHRAAAFGMFGKKDPGNSRKSSNQ